MKRILCVDVHDIITLGLEQIVTKIDKTWRVESASNSREVFEKLRGKDNWDLVVMAISFDGKIGLNLLQEINDIYPDLPILMFSTFEGVDFVRRSLKLGANGYLLKDSNKDEISSAIKSVINGGNYVNEAIRDELIFSPHSKNHAKLSDREFEVLIMIGKGFTTKEIAARLNISVNTVDTYRARVKEKMNLSRDSYLIHYCVTAGLVKLKPHMD